MKTGDRLRLILDCDSRKISLANERTGIQHELTVSIVQCPFPWQLHLNLFEANSRVRVLSA